MRDVAADVRDNSDTQQRRLFIIAIDDATIENDPKAIKSVKDIARGVVDRLGPADVASVSFTPGTIVTRRISRPIARGYSRRLTAFTVGFRGQGTAA
jgi:hypothetical protein